LASVVSNIEPGMVWKMDSSDLKTAAWGGGEKPVMVSSVVGKTRSSKIREMTTTNHQVWQTWGNDQH